MEVHDLDNEKTQCQIDEIIRAGHAVAFHSLDAEHASVMAAQATATIFMGSSPGWRTRRGSLASAGDQSVPSLRSRQVRRAAAGGVAEAGGLG
jgi:hypothetical protein